MKLRVTIGERVIGIVLPVQGDVEIDLSDINSEDVKRDDDVPTTAPKTLADAGPSTRRAFRLFASECDTDGRLAIDTTTMCENLNLSPFQLGKTLGKLERMNLLTRDKRHRDNETGKVLGYDVRVLDIEAGRSQVEDTVDLAKGLWVTTLEDIRSELDDTTEDLFVAICKLADVDGNVVAPPSEILTKMKLNSDVFPSSKLSILEDHGWISISDDGAMLCLSVTSYRKLKEGGMPWRDWQEFLPQP